MISKHILRNRQEHLVKDASKAVVKGTNDSTVWGSHKPEDDIITQHPPPFKSWCNERTIKVKNSSPPPSDDMKDLNDVNNENGKDLKNFFEAGNPPPAVEGAKKKDSNLNHSKEKVSEITPLFDHVDEIKDSKSLNNVEEQSKTLDDEPEIHQRTVSTHKVQEKKIEEPKEETWYDALENLSNNQSVISNYKQEDVKEDFIEEKEDNNNSSHNSVKTVKCPY